MKKVISIILVIACLAGLCFLGYTVFRSKNIVSAEVEGQMQTLYLVNETTTPDFEDAKLKVTYKNGTAKYIDLKSKSVKVNDFSTSIEAHGIMKLTYKSQTIEVPYNVIKSGLYYVKSHQVKTNGQTSEVSTFNSIKDTTIMFSLESDGVLKFYEKRETGWYLFDGAYDDAYSYKLSGDTLTVKHGSGKNDFYSIQAEYSNGAISINARTEFLDSEGDPTEIHTYKFVNFTDKTRDVSVTSASIKAEAPCTGYNVNGNFVFKRNQTIKTSNNSIYMKVEFDNFLISVKDAETGAMIEMLKTVYVKVTDKMVTHLYTNANDNVVKTAEVHYEDYKGAVSFKYIVES